MLERETAEKLALGRTVDNKAMPKNLKLVLLNLEDIRSNCTDVIKQLKNNIEQCNRY